MPSLTKSAIHQAQDITYQRVETPEWGGYVIAKALNGSERHAVEQYAAFQEGAIVRIDAAKLRLIAVITGTVDDDLKPIFTLDDTDWLNTKSAAALERVAASVLSQSGLMPDSKDKAAANFLPINPDDLRSD